VRSRVRSVRSRVQARSCRISAGETKDGRSIPRSVSFACQTLSTLSSPN
jgi:hypothetical protein